MAYFSKEEMVKWYNTLPSVPLGAKIILTNQKNEVLIVKTTYRPGWQLIGGVVNKDESPLQAVLRETTEETSLVLEPSRLTFRGTGYTKPRHGVPGVLSLVFAAQLTNDEVANLSMQKKEIEQFSFVSLDKLPREELNPSLAEAIAFHEAGVEAGYVEDGQVEVKI